jgi:hypothetical protein
MLETSVLRTPLAALWAARSVQSLFGALWRESSYAP